MKKNIENALCLLFWQLPFMALGQLPSINPLPERFRPVCHGRVDSIIEKRILPETDCSLQIYYFDDHNRLKNIINECGYERQYFYSQNDTIKILPTFLPNKSKGSELPLPRVASVDSILMIDYAPKASYDTLQISVYKDCMGRYLKIIAHTIVYADFVYDKENRILAYTVSDQYETKHHSIKYNDFLNRRTEICVPDDLQIPLLFPYTIQIFNSKGEVIKIKSGNLTQRGKKIATHAKEIRYKNDKQGNWIEKKSNYAKMFKKIEKREIYYKK